MSSSSPFSESTGSVLGELVDSQEDSLSFSTSLVRADDANTTENSSDGTTFSDPPRRIGYDWVSTQVIDQCSKYKWLESLEYFVASAPWLLPTLSKGWYLSKKTRSSTMFS